MSKENRIELQRKLQEISWFVTGALPGYSGKEIDDIDVRDLKDIYRETKNLRRKAISNEVLELENEDGYFKGYGIVGRAQEAGIEHVNYRNWIAHNEDLDSFIVLFDRGNSHYNIVREATREELNMEALSLKED